MKLLVVTDYQFPDGEKGEAMKRFMPDFVGSLNLGWEVNGLYVKWGNIRPEKLESAIEELRGKGHVFEIKDLRGKDASGLRDIEA